MLNILKGILKGKDLLLNLWVANQDIFSYFVLYFFKIILYKLRYERPPLLSLYLVIFLRAALISNDLRFYGNFCRHLLNSCHPSNYCPLLRCITIWHKDHLTICHVTCNFHQYPCCLISSLLLWMCNSVLRKVLSAVCYKFLWAQKLSWCAMIHFRYINSTIGFRTCNTLCRIQSLSI